MFIAIFWIFGAFLCAYVANQKGRSGAAWWFLAMVFSPLLILIALCAVPSLERKPAEAAPRVGPSRYRNVPPAYLTSL